MKTSEIIVQVETDENHVPEKMLWSSGDNKEPAECKALIFSAWDGAARETLRIDLWTKDMMLDEMKYFMHQTLLTMADTFEKATGEREMAMSMRDFSDYFAEKMGFSAGE